MQGFGYDESRHKGESSSVGPQGRVSEQGQGQDREGSGKKHKHKESCNDSVNHQLLDEY